MGFRDSVSLLPAIQATGFLALTLAGLTPAERIRLRWTHSRTCGFPSYGSSAPPVSIWRGDPMTETPRVIRLRPRSGTLDPDCSVYKGVYPAFYLAFHDRGPRQRIRRHHPTTRSPRHLPASAAVQPGTPGTRCRIVYHAQALAVTPGRRRTGRSHAASHTIARPGSRKGSTRKGSVLY